jgi:hypothetical protein
MGLTFVRKGDSEKEETFIDRYQQYGLSRTDAPGEYHITTGAVILSTIMAPFAVLKTSFGEIRPNLWTMILAGTTTTRKSTSMDMAVKILDDCHPDYYMGNDGSPEGILQELSQRDGRVSLFHRDEITGFMDAAMKKDYNAGMLESLTRLYDGKREKRILRSQVIDIHKPRLVFMCGGITRRMTEVVTLHHIGSGFLPRFLIVQGTTTADQIRPISFNSDSRGPDLSELILKELYDLIEFWMPSGTNEISTGGLTKKVKKVPTERKMTVTPEAEIRLQELENDANRYGEDSSNPDIYGPMYTRLAQSIMKVSILIAGSRHSTEITFNDVCQAIRLSDIWLNSAEKFARAVEEKPDMSANEIKLQKIVSYVSRSLEGVPRSEIMRKFHVNRREMDAIEETMIERGYVKKVKERMKIGKTGAETKPTVKYHGVESDDPLATFRHSPGWADSSAEASFS